MAWSPLEPTRLWPSLGMPSERQNWGLMECCTVAPSVHCNHPPSPGSSGWALWDPSQNLCLYAGLAFNFTCLNQGPWLNHTHLTTSWVCCNRGEHTLSWLVPWLQLQELCVVWTHLKTRESNLISFHEAQRKIHFRVNICMHIGCELFTKQAGHNGFQFLLTATCIDCDRLPEMNDTSIVKLVSEFSLSISTEQHYVRPHCSLWLILLNSSNLVWVILLFYWE